MTTRCEITEENKVVYRALQDYARKTDRLISENKISEFIGTNDTDIKRIEKAIKGLDLTPVLEADVDNFVNKDKLQTLRKKLQKNPEAVLKFAKDCSEYKMQVSESRQLPKTDTQLNHYAKFFTTEPTKTPQGEVVNVLKARNERAEKSLLDKIQGLPVSHRYAIVVPEGEDSVYFSYLFALWALVEDVMNACDIQPDFLPIPNQWAITYTHIATKSILEAILADIFIEWKASRGEITNLHANVSDKPSIDTRIMRKLGDELSSRNESLQKAAEQGLVELAPITNNDAMPVIDKATAIRLAPMFEDDEAKTHAKLLDYMVLSTTEAYSALCRYLADHPNPPKEIPIEDIAVYHGLYRRQLGHRRSLLSKYRERLSMQLMTLLGGYPVSTRTESYGGMYKDVWTRVYPFKFSVSMDKKYILDLTVPTEFIEWSREGIGMLLPESTDELNKAETSIVRVIMLAFLEGYERLLDGKKARRQSATIKGVPIRLHLTHLISQTEWVLPDKKSLDSKTYSKKMDRVRSRLAKCLNNIKSGGDIIERWTREKGTDIYTLYPAKYLQENYVDRPTRAARKANNDKEQIERRKVLEDLIRVVRENEKFSDEKREPLGVVCEKLGITRDELGSHRIRKSQRKKAVQPEPISDELYAKIESALKEID